jgi:hypothetical protein
MSTVLWVGYEPTGLPARQGASDPTAIVELFHAYAAGDFDIVARTLQTRDDFPVAHPAGRIDVRAERIDQLNHWAAALEKDWHGEWRPVQATFLLEVAVAASKIASPDAEVGVLLSTGGTRVIRRPTPFGANAADDRFENTWHRAAVGLLEGLPNDSLPRTGPTMATAYLDVIEKRYGAAHVHDFAGLIALARAIALAQGCCALLDFKTLDSRGEDPTVAGTAKLDAAIHAFDVAAKYPDTRQEALVRGAFLLLQRQRLEQALHQLDGLQDDPRDPDLAYWAHVIGGRVRDALHRFDDGAREYRAALAVRPHAQSGGIGLTLDLLRGGHRDDAAGIATDVVTAPKDVLDPWWTFDAADARFVQAWLVELRQRNR